MLVRARGGERGHDAVSVIKLLKKNIKNVTLFAIKTGFIWKLLKYKSKARMFTHFQVGYYGEGFWEGDEHVSLT